MLPSPEWLLVSAQLRSWREGAMDVVGLQTGSRHWWRFLGQVLAAGPRDWRRAETLIGGMSSSGAGGGCRSQQGSVNASAWLSRETGCANLPVPQSREVAKIGLVL